MQFFEIYIQGFAFIIIFFTMVWALSVYLKNASIVDTFWGPGFIVVSLYYFFATPGNNLRENIVMILVAIWGLRLSAHIFIRNLGKPEDYRYREFRRNFGEKRYWWFSFFQVFLLQGSLLWLISGPLLGVSFYTTNNELNFFDILALLIWLTGFVFEAGGDWQLTKFKANPANAGKLLTSGFWKYTRHPNYFGDAAVWWGFALLGVAAGSWTTLLSAVLMTWLLVKVSGVAMLERTLINTKPGFEDYIKKTSAFVPWLPKLK